MLDLRKGGLAAAVSIAALAAATATAHAGAFQLNERSTASQGMSFANSVSGARDVTFASFNPAALTTVENFEIGGNVSIVAPVSDGTVQNGPFAGTSYDADRTGVVPSMAVGYRVWDGLVIGFTSYSPFGLRTAYETLPVTVDARTSELRTISFSPTVSYDVLPNLTFGASFNILYADARLTNALLNLDGSDVGYGFSVGALFEPIEGTTIGAAYHHGYDLEIDTAIFGGAVPAALGVRGTAEASLPGWVQVGITQEITDDFRMSVEGRWINWSVFDTIDISSPVLNTSDVQNYNDALFFALGGEYDITDALTVRAGVAFDETPTSDAFRTPRVPDEDRIWGSVGVSYALSDSMSIDMAYSYLRALRDPDVTLKGPGVAGTQLEYEGGAHIFSIGGSMRF